MTSELTSDILVLQLLTLTLTPDGTKNFSLKTLFGVFDLVAKAAKAPIAKAPILNEEALELPLHLSMSSPTPDIRAV